MNIGDEVKKVDGSLFFGGFLTKRIVRFDDNNTRVWISPDGTTKNETFTDKDSIELVNTNERPETKTLGAPINPQYNTFKADQGKPRWSLLMDGCANAIAGVVRVLTFAVAPVDQGGKGYKPHSWQEVPNAKERYRDALHRHLNKIALGETHDDESKELHWHHVATNALFLAELEVKGDSK